MIPPSLLFLQRGNEEYFVRVDLAQLRGFSPTLAGGWHDSVAHKHEKGWTGSHHDIELYRLSSPQRSAKCRQYLSVLGQRLRFSRLLAPGHAGHHGRPQALCSASLMLRGQDVLQQPSSSLEFPTCPSSV